jgi:hypothetical protein
MYSLAQRRSELKGSMLQDGEARGTGGERADDRETVAVSARRATRAALRWTIG